MATNQDTPKRQAILDALTKGETIRTVDRASEPDANGYDPSEDFVIAWLRYWRSLGNDVVAQRDGSRGFYVSEFHPTGYPLAADQPPHLAIWNAEQHNGATRAMEALLTAVPGARAALSSAVRGR